MTDGTNPCCSPGRGDRSAHGAGLDAERTSRGSETTSPDETSTSHRGMVELDGGTFSMGTDSDEGYPEDGEGPIRDVTVNGFLVDRRAVTNREFFRFVEETGYRTDAERYSWSFVFADFVSERDREHELRNVPAAPWWVAVRGATWLRPEGPYSNVLADGRLDHPVTQVSWNDAVAYAAWAGKRLPTEAEWEYAARGGTRANRFPWGDDLRPNGSHRCNVWQGTFPESNTGEDGFVKTAPVGAFEPNGYGLYNVVGNVWEWCDDWFSAVHHATDRYDATDPTGPPAGEQKVMKGGSYLCHRSWCNRYRLAARSKNDPESATGNIGFRCVRDTDG